MSLQIGSDVFFSFLGGQKTVQDSDSFSESQIDCHIWGKLRVVVTVVLTDRGLEDDFLTSCISVWWDQRPSNSRPYHPPGSSSPEVFQDPQMKFCCCWIYWSPLHLQNGKKRHDMKKLTRCWCGKYIYIERERESERERSSLYGLNLGQFHSR